MYELIPRMLKTDYSCIGLEDSGLGIGLGTGGFGLGIRLHDNHHFYLRNLQVNILGLILSMINKAGLHRLWTFFILGLSD